MRWPIRSRKLSPVRFVHSSANESAAALGPTHWHTSCPPARNASANASSAATAWSLAVEPMPGAYRITGRSEAVCMQAASRPPAPDAVIITAGGSGGLSSPASRAARPSIRPLRASSFSSQAPATRRNSAALAYSVTFMIVSLFPTRQRGIGHPLARSPNKKARSTRNGLVSAFLFSVFAYRSPLLAQSVMDHSARTHVGLPYWQWNLAAICIMGRIVRLPWISVKRNSGHPAEQKSAGCHWTLELGTWNLRIENSRARPASLPAAQLLIASSTFG